MSRIAEAFRHPFRAVRHIFRHSLWIIHESWLSFRRRGQGAFDNPYPVCRCLGPCSHDVDIHSYVGAYQAVLDQVRPSKVFEWGPGHNSAMAISAGAEVFAVEFDPAYVPDLPERFFHPFLVPVADPAGFASLRGITDADIYFIDSRHRRECLRSVLANAQDRAIVCLHDAQRLRYQVPLREFPYVKFLSAGFCVASRSPEAMSIRGG